MPAARQGKNPATFRHAPAAHDHARIAVDAARGMRAPDGMDPLTAFGLFAITFMLFAYALEERSPWFSLAFGAGCVLGSIYGFLQGAWPFGVVEAIWAVLCVLRFRQRMKARALAPAPVG